ncbi:cyclic-AMP phosphodiesterase [Kockovaella imperatae]|uniref:Cyclic-AMP phosphodiesterase n=1 Tax=Kockovaella imperatae TaxID=4999 RepID=A0A1Y1UC55_9TREE|nr:cyclic-AMP phosphodiesterase [Kockovaella imperatae]ORX35621.1 cyclic-AMP phosphodiesterase [Kockovaella imperatae]
MRTKPALAGSGRKRASNAADRLSTSSAPLSPIGQPATRRSSRSSVDKGKQKAAQAPPHETAGRHVQDAFEIVVLGAGGGPLETDVSGYMLKPAHKGWEEGFVALEGGSGLGALTELIDRHGSSSLFPSTHFPPTHHTALLKAAYIFSYLSCYLITHAHLDHVQSLILFSGSMPPRGQPPDASILSPPLTSKAHSSDDDASSDKDDATPAPSRMPVRVLGAKPTLDRLSLAYGGELWPEIADWEKSHGGSASRLEARRGSLGSYSDGPLHPESHGSEMILVPLPGNDEPVKVSPSLPLSVRQFEVSHGSTSKGAYESTALFIRLTDHTVDDAMTHLGHGFDARSDSSKEPELLFFGDVESSYRSPGSEDQDTAARDRAEQCNGVIWAEAADLWAQGRLSGIFIECSYDNDRSADLMFGHMHPYGLMHELSILAAKVTPSRDRPLAGLKIYITHIKAYLLPHPSGQTASERIMSQLDALEKERNLGVDFVEVKRGMRIVL